MFTTEVRVFPSCALALALVLGLAGVRAFVPFIADVAHAHRTPSTAISETTTTTTAKRHHSTVDITSGELLASDATIAC